MTRRGLFFRFAFATIIISAAFGMAVSVAEHGGRLKGLAPAILAVARFPNHVRAAFYQLRHKSYQVLAVRTGDCGVSVLHEGYSDSNFVLVSTFEREPGQSTIKLIRVSDGGKVMEWVPSLDGGPVAEYKSRHHGRPEKPNMRFQHPILYPDGSIVTYRGGGPMFRLDRDSHYMWILEGEFHHSLELDADSNIWACTSPDPGYLDSVVDFKGHPFEDNAIICVSPEGQVLYERSVSRILTENGLEGILYGTGLFERDAIHLNDVQPALCSTSYWKKGDLLLSFRHLSMIMLYRPSEERVIWYRMGNWINQHDADFVDSTRISLFGNDMVRNISSPDWMRHGTSDIYIIDLSTDSVSRPYSRILHEQGIACEAEGLCDILPGGRVFIEQTKPGRLMIADPEYALWSYTQCAEKDMSCIFAWSRYVERKNIPAFLLKKAGD